MSEQSGTAPAQPETPGPSATTAEPQRPQRAILGVISFGLATGITAAVAMFVVAITAGLFEWGVQFVLIMSSLYIGYMPSFVGAIVGAVWGFVDGFLGGMLIAWLYNTFVQRH